MVRKVRWICFGGCGTWDQWCEMATTRKAVLIQAYKRLLWENGGYLKNLINRKEWIIEIEGTGGKRKFRLVPHVSELH